MKLLGRRNRRATQSDGDGALVLMYHGVAEVDIDPWGLFVSPLNFESHLQVLAENTHPMPLTEFAAAQERGALPPRAVAITADDGYANFASNARPLLERYQLSATLFALSAPLREGGEYWWDRLAALLLVPGVLPETLVLELDEPITIDLGPAAAYTIDGWRADHRYRDGDPPGPRMDLYRTLWERLRPIDHDRRKALLDGIAAWAGTSADPRETHRNLTVDEIAALDGHTVHVGGHTVTHPLLPELPVRQQRREIVDNKRHLEDILNRPVEAFSYPFGGHNNTSALAVRAAGYKAAVTTRPTAVTASSDRFRLGRFDVKNWNGDEFARRVEQWFRS
jgi:peptidoglycan/xylan/chitin deacetylase (PgdA/CDA1 family)